jgi:MFS transporter, DHA3 family, macrolide efflux protein
MPESVDSKQIIQNKLWNKDFTLFWLGSAQSNLGSALSSVALSFLTLEVTGSVGAMGFSLALGLIPSLFAPLAGTWVDRMPLRIPLVLGDALHGLLLLAIAFLASHSSLTALAIYAFSLLNGLVGMVANPTSSSLLPQLVPRDQIARASGLLAMSSQGMQLLGLLGGGWMVAKLGTVPALVFDGITFVIMALLYLFIQMPRVAASSNTQNFGQDLLEGLGFVRSNRVISLICGMGLLINAAFAPIEMYLPKQMTLFGVGASGFALFLVLLTVGMLASSAAISALGNCLRPSVGIGLGLTFMAFTLLLMGIFPHYPVFLIMAVLLGATLALINTSIMILMQSIVPLELRGRTFGFLGALVQAGMPLTLLLLSPVADRVSFSSVLVLAGVICAAMVWVWLQWGHRAAEKQLEGQTLHSNPPNEKLEPQG